MATAAVNASANSTYLIPISEFAPLFSGVSVRPPRQRRQSWSKTVPKICPDRSAAPPPDRPRAAWTNRRLVPLSFVSPVITPLPLEGEQWKVGYFSNSPVHERVGSVLAMPLLGENPILSVLHSGGLSEADIPASAHAAVFLNSAGFCCAAKSFPWQSGGSTDTTLPRQVATRSRLVLIVVGRDSIEPGDTFSVAGACLEFSCQIIDPHIGMVIADHPRILRLGEGKSEPAFLVEVSCSRSGQAKVKRVATLDYGLDVGTVITAEQAPTTSDLDAHRRAMVVNATRIARARHPTGKLGNERVEHELERMGGSGIGPTLADFKAALALPVVAQTTARQVSWLRAHHRWKNLPAAQRRIQPNPGDVARAWFRFARGEVLLKLGGALAWTPGAVVPVIEPIKPATREPILPTVASCTTFPYPADARTPHVQKVKSRSGARGSLVQINCLAELKEAGFAKDFRTIRPQVAISMASEIAKLPNLDRAVVKQLEETSRLHQRRTSVSLPAGRRAGWDENGSLRWASAMVCKFYVESLARKSRSFSSFVECLGEAEGISKLRWDQLSPAAAEALVAEPKALEARSNGRGSSAIVISRPYEQRNDLGRLRFFFVDGPVGTSLEKMWERLADGRSYRAGVPAVAVKDRVTLRGLDDFGRTKPPKAASEAASSLVAALLQHNRAATLLETTEILADCPPWAVGAAVEVIECARILHNEKATIAGTSEADIADHRECHVRRRWATAVCKTTLPPSLWSRLSTAWRLS